MDYRKFGDTVVARFDRGEEFTSSLQELCEKENIKLASVSAIGALNAFTAGVYMVDEKRYVKNEFKGCFEIVSLTGTVNGRQVLQPSAHKRRRRERPCFRRTS